MKKFILIVFAGISLYAHNNTGCGIGSLMIQNQNSVLKQLLAVTTNGTTANQMFGISSGSLGCETAKSLVKNEKIEIFLKDNLDTIAKEIALGGGESVDTLATLMKIKDKKLFVSTLQNNFNSIFKSKDMNFGEVYQNISNI